MEKKKTDGRKPSRRKYEEECPTISFRLDKKTHAALKQHLAGTSCSFADFIKDALGRENSMVEKRVEALAGAQVSPSVEDRLRGLEGFVHQLLSTAGIADPEWLPICPRCDEDMSLAEGTETESKLRHPEVLTWQCPKCGYFADSFGRINPKSLVMVKLEIIPKVKESLRSKQR